MKTDAKIKDEEEITEFPLDLLTDIEDQELDFDSMDFSSMIWMLCRYEDDFESKVINCLRKAKRNGEIKKEKRGRLTFAVFQGK